jgi:hypothetical protein
MVGINTQSLQYRIIRHEVPVQPKPHLYDPAWCARLIMQSLADLVKQDEDWTEVQGVDWRLQFLDRTDH